MGSRVYCVCCTLPVFDLGFGILVGFYFRNGMVYFVIGCCIYDCLFVTFVWCFVGKFGFWFIIVGCCFQVVVFDLWFLVEFLAFVLRVFIWLLFDVCTSGCCWTDLIWFRCLNYLPDLGCCNGLVFAVQGGGFLCLVSVSWYSYGL